MPRRRACLMWPWQAKGLDEEESGIAGILSDLLPPATSFQMSPRQAAADSRHFCLSGGLFRPVSTTSPERPFSGP